MLAITRKTGESVRVGEAIIWITKCQQGRCRLVIDAPREVPIVRSELETPVAGVAVPAPLQVAQ